ncbi:hypothetical protein BT69DRAFT_1286699 [Atractiella rhizophila]|nr:hypothetical protein BT69DRAFT_1286699 [Atractiella rhizophila]
MSSKAPAAPTNQGLTTRLPSKKQLLGNPSKVKSGRNGALRGHGARKGRGVDLSVDSEEEGDVAEGITASVEEGAEKGGRRTTVLGGVRIRVVRDSKRERTLGGFELVAPPNKRVIALADNLNESENVPKVVSVNLKGMVQEEEDGWDLLEEFESEKEVEKKKTWSEIVRESSVSK